MDGSFAEAMNRVYRTTFDAHLREWADNFNIDTRKMALKLLTGEVDSLPSFELNVAIDLPAELDQFTDEHVRRFLHETARRP
jgi:hypothetical protein